MNKKELENGIKIIDEQIKHHNNELKRLQKLRGETKFEIVSKKILSRQSELENKYGLTTSKRIINKIKNLFIIHNKLYSVNDFIFMNDLGSRNQQINSEYIDTMNSLQKEEKEFYIKILKKYIEKYNEMPTSERFFHIKVSDYFNKRWHRVDVDNEEDLIQEIHMI